MYFFYVCLVIGSAGSLGKIRLIGFYKIDAAEWVICINICIYIYVCIVVCINIYTYIYVFIYTYIAKWVNWQEVRLRVAVAEEDEEGGGGGVTVEEEGG
jgi:hypothetical protein